MIPLLLEIKNFLSYGEPVQRIDFEPYQLICLSGKNGNGKSALLDAITWALWGQARKVTGAAKADDGLVRLGQSRMMVSLTFLFNNLTYRVRREYAKTYGKPYAALDFEIYEKQRERFISLTDKTIRATQAKIQSLIGLDFETFVNSAFIRQGQSNEFSKKSAKERKHILGTILGLNKYDALQQAALDKAKTFDQEKKILSFNVQQALQTVAQEEGIIADVASKQTALEGITKIVMLQQQLLLSAQQKNAALTSQLSYYTTLRTTLADKKTLFDQQKAALQTAIKTWRTIHAQSLHMSSPHELDAKKKALTQAEDLLMKQHGQYMLLQQQLLAAKQELIVVQQQLRSAAEKQLLEHTMVIQNVALEQRHHEAVRQEKTKQFAARTSLITLLTTETQKIALELPSFATCETTFLITKNQFDKRRTYYQTLVQRGNWTKQQHVDLERRQLFADDTSSPACPLCQQLLTAKRKQFLASTFELETRHIKHRLLRITKLITKLKEILVEQHVSVTAMTQQHEQQVRKQMQYNEAIKQITTEQHELDVLELESAKLALEQTSLQQKLITANQMLDAIQKSLEHTVQNDPSVTAITALTQNIEEQIKQLNWQQEAYQQLQQQRTELDRLIALHEQYQTAQASQRERRQDITRAFKEIKILIIAQKQLEIDLLGEEQTKQQLLTLQTEMVSLQEQHQAHSKEKELVLHSLGRLEHELQTIAALRISVGQTKQKIDACEVQMHQFQQLATAFSKNGIQALLIEEAIPEIEHETNILLSRLTDNQAHIFIESLKDLKNGGVKETLDIHIADTAGIRPYELFSGGEAFRVDFALRIAIAKLLARRAGTALQTLIIDEGFGSQDEEGLAHIMEALYSIQQDFAKIIIVSHLPEFKQNFPVHFIVDKGSTGSIVRIEERG